MENNNEKRPFLTGFMGEYAMTDKQLKRLSRADLLSMLLTLSKENEDLRQQLEQARQELDRRSIAVQESGSLAEAALRLNGVFEAAQAACQQYTENIRQRSESVDSYCAERERQTQEKCDKMLADAKARVDAYLIREAQKLKSPGEAAGMEEAGEWAL